MNKNVNNVTEGQQSHAVHSSVTRQICKKVSLCGAGAIEIGGEIFIPDAYSAYVEMFFSYAFPCVVDVNVPGKRGDFTAFHPQVVANSYAGLKGKWFNLAHLIKAYDPKNNPRDRILGTIMGVEFPPTPEGGWKVQASTAAAPGVRAVAVMHKDAEGVPAILQSWREGKTPFGDGDWTVSMENDHDLYGSGFLVLADGEAGHGLETFAKSTPEDFHSLGYVYVPWADAPKEVLDCLNSAADDERDGTSNTRIVRDYRGFKTVFLIGGLDGRIAYKGVGLVPLGRESTARVGRMLASGSELVEVNGLFEPLEKFMEALTPSLSRPTVEGETK